ncbi:MAG TPA: hypothetical protein VJ830_05850, partial [Anaerolineales bacterium]|nr:hypothetical protein [Anaerolineales bacterium]
DPSPFHNYWQAMDEEQRPAPVKRPTCSVAPPTCGDVPGQAATFPTRTSASASRTSPAIPPVISRSIGLVFR